MSQVTLDEQRVQIVAAAEKGNTLVVPTVVKIPAATAYTVSLHFQSFVNLLAHSKPTAMYLLAVKFDPQEDLESWWDIDEDDKVHGPSAEFLLGDKLVGDVIGVRGRVPSGPMLAFNYDVSFGWPLYKPAGFRSQQPAVMAQVGMEF